MNKKIFFIVLSAVIVGLSENAYSMEVVTDEVVIDNESVEPCAEKEDMSGSIAELFAKGFHFAVRGIGINAQTPMHRQLEEVLGESNNDIQEALFSAAEKGYAEAILPLVTRGAKVNKKQYKHGPSPMIIAIRNGHTNVVEMLCKNGARVNPSSFNPSFRYVTRHGAPEYPLVEAARYNQAEAIEVLSRYGAQVNSPGGEIIIAKKTSSKKIAFRRPSPLHNAAETCALKSMKALCALGADVGDIDRNGCTPLHWVAGSNSINVLGELLDELYEPMGNDHDIRKRAENLNTPFLFEKIKPPFDDHGFDTDELDLISSKFLCLINDKGLVPDVEAIFSADASVGNAKFWNKFSIILDDNLCSQEITTLYEHGAQLDIRNNSGRTPLHYAIDKGRVKPTKTLLLLSALASLDTPQKQEEDLKKDEEKIISWLWVAKKLNLPREIAYYVLLYRPELVCNSTYLCAVLGGATDQDQIGNLVRNVDRTWFDQALATQSDHVKTSILEEMKKYVIEQSTALCKQEFNVSDGEETTYYNFIEKLHPTEISEEQRSELKQLFDPNDSMLERETLISSYFDEKIAKAT